MALLEKDRMVEEVKSREDVIKSLEYDIEEGRWAERLSVSLDFKRFVESVRAPFISWDAGQKLQYYDSILAKAATRDQKDAAVEHIKEMNIAFESVNNVVNSVDNKIARARQASEELKSLKGE